MKPLTVIVSALTAFTIGATGTLIGVIASGYKLNKASWITACVVGLFVAAKDTRSLLQLPPVSVDGIIKEP